MHEKTHLLDYQKNLGENYANSLPLLGHMMADILCFFDCPTVFGIGGDFVANLIEAFEGRIDTVPSGNEMHAGYSACAQAEISGIGAALVTYTVGSLPTTSPAALAMAERLPVIFISGAPGESELNKTTLHHTVASSSSWTANVDCALNAFRALGMRAERLQGERCNGQPSMAAETFFQLVTHAYLNKEPVFIEVPRDLVFTLTQTLRLPQSKNHLNLDTYVLEGAEFIAQHICEKLERAKSPLLYIGENVRLNKRLCDLIMKLSDSCGIPYATSWLGKGIFDEQSALSIGSYNGVFSQSYCREYIEQKADYILEIDTNIQKQDTNNAFGSGTHSVERFNNKTTIKGTVQNQQGLINVLQLVLTHRLPVFDINLPEKPRLKYRDNEKLDFHNLAQTLNDIQASIEPSLIYIPEIGSSYFASFGLVTKASSYVRSWLTNPWYGAMGTSLSYARAVSRTLRQANADDVAVVITGDGGFHFQLNELIHFQREKLCVVILYLRNDIFHLGKSGQSKMYDCSTPEFDIISLVGAYGGKGVRCETVGQLQAELQEAITINRGITLCEIPCNTEPQYQSPEINLLNLFIQKNNAVPGAEKKWREAITPNTESSYV